MKGKQLVCFSLRKHQKKRKYTAITWAINKPVSQPIMCIYWKQDTPQKMCVHVCVVIQCTNVYIHVDMCPFLTCTYSQFLFPLMGFKNEAPLICRDVVNGFGVTKQNAAQRRRPWRSGLSLESRFNINIHDRTQQTFMSYQLRQT